MLICHIAKTTMSFTSFADLQANDRHLSMGGNRITLTYKVWFLPNRSAQKTGILYITFFAESNQQHKASCRILDNFKENAVRCCWTFSFNSIVSGSTVWIISFSLAVSVMDRIENEFYLQYPQLSVVWENSGRQVFQLILWQRPNKKNITVGSLNRGASVIYLWRLTRWG